MHYLDPSRRVALREILVLFAALFLPGIMAQAGPIDPNAFNSIAHHLQTMTIALAQSLLILHIVNLHDETDVGRFGFVPLRPRDLLPAVGIGFLLLLVVLPIGLLDQTLFGTEEGLPSGVRFRLDRPELLPLVIPTSLAIGYREELFFRAFLLPRLDDLGVSMVGAVAISTAAFAVGHLYQGLLGGVVAVIMGVILSAVFLRRRNVHVVAIAHAFYNAAVLTSSYFIFPSIVFP
jgi:uncharacterized protein